MSILDKVKEMISGSASGSSKGSGMSRPGRHASGPNRAGRDDKIDRAADRMDDMTGGRFDEQIDRGRDAAKDKFEQ